MAGRRGRRAAPAAAAVRDALLGGLLWAPWRMQYVRGLTARGTRRCPFCPMVRRPDDAAQHVLHRGAHAFLVLNRYPYTTGHVLAVPNRHVGRLEGLRPAERRELWELALLAQRALAAEYDPAGFNLGMNLGRAGGAAVVDHVHAHVVPRFLGDSNFLATVGGARQCPEALDATWARLRPRFGRRRRPARGR
jgi:ATP adenylyltransferase